MLSQTFRTHSTSVIDICHMLNFSMTGGSNWSLNQHEGLCPANFYLWEIGNSLQTFRTHSTSVIDICHTLNFSMSGGEQLVIKINTKACFQRTSISGKLHRNSLQTFRTDSTSVLGICHMINFSMSGGEQLVIKINAKAVYSELLSLGNWKLSANI